jgi:RTX calcium-binding nonapeptide repeat (4 copies)
MFGLNFRDVLDALPSLDEAANGSSAAAKGDDDPFFGRYAPATVSEMASLAYAAYGYGEGDLPQQLAERAPGWQALGPAALNLSPERFTEDGYYERNDAAGYVAVEDSRLAIVYRGSDTVDDLLNTAFAQDNYFDDLRPLIQAALEYAAENGVTEILLTGHSLGGAMVQRTAAKIDDFAVPEGVEWSMAAFGPPGTDVGNTTPFSRSVLIVEHTGDPVLDDPLLSNLTQHGFLATIQLPNVEGANDLLELAEQKQAQDDDPAVITEHDVWRYMLSVQAIAGSPLYQDAHGETRAIVLDAADGTARDDVYQIDDDQRLLLGLDGSDQLFGSHSADLIDGGSGADIVAGKSGDDTLTGGSDDDTLTGGDGSDRFVVTASFGNDTITDFDSSEGDVLEFRGFGDALDSFADLEGFLAVGPTVGDTVIDLGEIGGGSLILAGASELLEEDVILVA